MLIHLRKILSWTSVIPYAGCDPISIIILELCDTVLSYAEIHYRPRFVPSLVYSSFPEILFDVPRRVEPERPVPLFLFIKDADRFPVELVEVAVRFVHESGTVRTVHFPYDAVKIDSPVWWDSFNIIPEREGSYAIHPALRFRMEGRYHVAGTDNYPSCSHAPLGVHVSPTSFPCAGGWFLGDIHCHTSFTDDQVEFGAPLEAVVFGAYCSGMSWIAATDHSYDLDDLPGDYLTTDPSLGKWKVFKETVALLNGSLDSFAVIPGEEVTCRTRRGRNCHMLALGSEKYIPGSGDGGEHGFSHATERSIREAAIEISEWGGIACAAHPLEHIPLSERILLGRGPWKHEDLDTTGVAALQFHNGVRDAGFRRGMATWVGLLLAGRRVSAFGGNDSHGDMNLRRSIGVPFLTLRESARHVLGGVRTAVRARSGSWRDILDGLSSGHAVVTEGPFIDLRLRSGGIEAGPGDECPGSLASVSSVCASTPEFGLFRSGRILGGKKDERAERVIADLAPFIKGNYSGEFVNTFSLHGYRYIRAECETDKRALCFTNPVWIDYPRR